MIRFSTYKQFLVQPSSSEDQNGFSSNEMVVVIVSIGILTTIIIPLFIPVIEMTEVLIAEKYLLGAVRECQTGLVNGEDYPRYTLPPQAVGLGFISTRKFQFPYSGVDGECLSSSGGNILTASRTSENEMISIYSLNINVVTGEKTTEGYVPSWLDWWNGSFSPIIPEDDPILQ